MKHCCRLGDPPALPQGFTTTFTRYGLNVPGPHYWTMVCVFLFLTVGRRGRENRGRERVDDDWTRVRTYWRAVPPVDPSAPDPPPCQ